MGGKNARPKPAASSSSSGRASKRPRREASVPEDQKPVSATAPPAVTDDRFSSLHWDPRFSRVPKATRALPVDDRFKAALVQNPAFRRGTAPVDRFGRTKEREGDALLKGLYDLESEDEDRSEDGSEGQVEDGEHDDDGESERESGYEAQIEVYDSEAEEEETREVIPRGQATKRLAVMGLDWTNARAVDLFVSLQSFCPPGKILKMVAVHPSKFGLERLAEESRLGPSVLQPADRAVVDRMKGGTGQGEAEVDESRVEDQVADEGGENGVNEGGSGDDDSESSDSDSDGDDGMFVESAVDVESRKQLEQQKMRKYEEDRLKYYFAVAEFEDTKSADAVYEQCDGVEFEKTGLSFDLRFIPDDMVIETSVRDSASSIPDNYAPPNLAPSTLNNCKVKLSWDADAPDRAILKKRTVGKREEEDENLKAYLASSSESEGEGGKGEGGGEEKEEELARKRLLLLGDPEEVEEEVGDKEMEMEITFEPGLQEKGAEIMRRKEVRETTVEESEWEARLRRMKERKAEKRETRKKEIAKKHGKLTSSGDEDATPVDDGMYGDVMDNPRFANDPFFSNALSDNEDAPKAPAKKKDKKERKKSAKAKKAKEATEQAEVGSLDSADVAERSRRDANLELIMMRDDRGKDGNSLRDRLVDEDSDDEDAKKKKKKGRSRGRRRSDREAAALAAASKTPKTALDTSDDRFAGLYSSHMFAMDPTHPKFKRNETTEQILKEKKRRGGSTAESAAASSSASGALSKKSGSIAESAEARDDIMSLAANIKAKSSKKAGKKKRPCKVKK